MVSNFFRKQVVLYPRRITIVVIAEYIYHQTKMDLYISLIRNKHYMVEIKLTCQLHVRLVNIACHTTHIELL